MNIKTAPWLKRMGVILIALSLSACVSQLLLGDAQSRLMWALLRPLVGFDPNELNLFENPLIKDRMVVLLGDKYAPTMKLLRTAREIKQEGALFYMVSRYAPKEVQEVADKAGFIWNGDTNQMAVMLIENGAPQIIAEPLNTVKEAILPKLPQELQVAYDVAKTLQEKKRALEQGGIPSLLPPIPQVPQIPEAPQIAPLRDQLRDQVL
jgi:hypothetical protein